MAKNRNKALAYAAAVMLLLLALGGVFSGKGEDAEKADAPARISAEEGASKYLALTFDDGPRADTTAVLLEGLDQRGVKATFFLIGEQIPGNEWLVRWMAESGHQVGNHTFTHVKLQGSSKDTVLQEINKTEVLLTTVLGERDYWLRPPYGLIDDAEKTLVRTPMIYWSVDPEDWKYLDTERVTADVVSHAKDGDIILLHDFYPTSVQAALQIVDQLRSEGYEFVTVEELMRLKGTVPRAGKIYSSATEERAW